jgi:hypothetical protein
MYITALLLLLLHASARLEAVPPQTADRRPPPVFSVFLLPCVFFLRFSSHGAGLVFCFSSLSSAPVAIFLFFSFPSLGGSTKERRGAL